jgi:ABC-2 type transport system permease protein
MLIVCFVLMGILCYFAVEMVIRKSFRVFSKGWPGAVGVSVMLALVCVGASVDITGYETRVPDAEDIESVEIDVYQEDVNLYECTEPETVEAILALHRVIAAEGEVPTGLDGYYNVHVDYKMTDGSPMRRRYTLSMPTVMENENIKVALDRVVNCREARYQSTLNRSVADPDLKLRGGYISGRYQDFTRQLTAEEATRIYKAVLADLENGAGKQQVLSPDTIPQCAVYIELESEAGYNSLWLDRIRPDFTETVDVLNGLGLDSATLFQVNWEYVEKYGW